MNSAYLKTYIPRKLSKDVRLAFCVFCVILLKESCVLMYNKTKQVVDKRFGV